MTERKEVKIPKRFVEKYGKDIPLWSYSKVNTLDNCTYEYYLARIKKYPSEDNVYTLLGTLSHSVLEDFYNGKIKYDDMADKFESDFIAIEISDYKFSSDEEKNNNMRDKYKECVIDFFKKHKSISDKVALEKIIWVDVKGNLFMGYVDAIHKEENNYIITDWKTSTIYSGKKIKENGKQLLLYALGLIQGGVPIENVKARWNFLKHTDITYQQKNGKFKTTNAERNKWVNKIKSPLKMFMKDYYTNKEEWEIDLMIDDCVKENSLQSLDNGIQNQFSLSDCYVYVDVNQESIDNLIKELTQAVNRIKVYGEKEENWERDEIEDKDSFYCNVLCGVKKHCKYYSAYLDKLGKNQEDETSILDELNKLDDLLPF